MFELKLSIVYDFASNKSNAKWSMQERQPTTAAVVK